MIRNRFESYQMICREAFGSGYGGEIFIEEPKSLGDRVGDYVTGVVDNFIGLVNKLRGKKNLVNLTDDPTEPGKGRGRRSTYMNAKMSAGGDC